MAFEFAQNVGGALFIPTSETRTNTAYGLMPTPDQVTGIVLPTNGLISVWYQATWQESVTTNARAAIFIGANQQKIAEAGTGASTVAAATNGASINTNIPLFTVPTGLASTNQAGYSGDVTTGQAIGMQGDGGAVTVVQEIGGSIRAAATPAIAGGPCVIFAAAGTYTISVQFKASGGATVTALNRRLKVKVI